MTFLILQGDANHIPLADESVQCVVTSPPFFGLRDYGVPPTDWPEMEYSPMPGLPPLTIPAMTCCLGLEPTPEAYTGHLVAAFRELWRVLRRDGVVWLNLGDSMAGSMKGMGANGKSYAGEKQATNKGSVGLPVQRWREGSAHADGAVCGDGQSRRNRNGIGAAPGLKPKDLCMIPARCALALQADGWWLRSDVIWCLSGGTVVYARTQKGDMPMTVKDMARLDPSTVQLWNGEKWTQLLGVSKSDRRGDEIELVLRSGERISCTPTHRFPTQRGVVDASDLLVGDVLARCQLPEPDTVMDCAIDSDAAWLAGLYIAEGSRAGDTIQITGHTRETDRWERVQRIAAKYGGRTTKTDDGNTRHIRMYGKVLCAILGELVTGRTAKDKGFAPHVWRYSNSFIAAMVDGYLSGDGYWDETNHRWRLGLTRNYNLERDLRTACARLGYILTLKLSSVQYNGKQLPSFRGEIRKMRSGHANERDVGEIIEIRKARCRQVYDLGVADEPHLFALASGVLTHNSKPNPMPESVTDRPTRSHEYLFLLSKSERYFYDGDAIREPQVCNSQEDALKRAGSYGSGYDRWEDARGYRGDGGLGTNRTFNPAGRNCRSVWTIATQPFPGSHFATFPPALVEPCIKAGTSERGCCPKCRAPWERIAERQDQGWDGSRYGEKAVAATRGAITGGTAHSTLGSSNGKGVGQRTTIGWQPTCKCNAGAPVPCIALDPFGGSGTTVLVADRLGRHGVAAELKGEYTKMAHERAFADAPLLALMEAANVTP